MGNLGFTPTTPPLCYVNQKCEFVHPNADCDAIVIRILHATRAFEKPSQYRYNDSIQCHVFPLGFSAREVSQNTLINLFVFTLSLWIQESILKFKLILLWYLKNT